MDGIYGPETTEAVKVWQTANGLVADGEMGIITW
jgi:peptidoglycan hydrolase-like protein with peptidoglycan-binding domain